MNNKNKNYYNMEFYTKISLLIFFKKLKLNKLNYLNNKLKIHLVQIKNSQKWLHILTKKSMMKKIYPLVKLI